MRRLVYAFVIRKPPKTGFLAADEAQLACTRTSKIITYILLYHQLLSCCMFKPRREKTLFCCMRTTKAQLLALSRKLPIGHTGADPGLLETGFRCMLAKLLILSRFLKCPVKTNDLIPLRPNYFIFIGYLIKAPQALHNTPPLLGAPKVIL